MPGDAFKRTVRGYDPEEVDAAIAQRDARLTRLEREVQRLAERVVEREKRLQIALKGPVWGGVEEIYGQARRQATRIRIKALEDAVEMADKVMELTRVGDDLRGRLNNFAGVARERLGGDPGSVRELADGMRPGTVTIDVGPLRDFSQLTGLEDALGRIEGTSNVRVARFSDGRATIVLDLESSTELARELERSAPYGIGIREARPDGLVLDVAEPAGEQQRAA